MKETRGSSDIASIPTPRPDRRPSATSAPPPGGIRETSALPHPSPQGWVLVVDDEPFVRRVVSRLLTRVGYRTLLAASASEALALLDDSDSPVDVVVADTAIPDASSTDFLRNARTRRPDVKAILMDDRGPGGRETEPEVPILPKPFGSRQLYDTLDEILDAPRDDSPPITTAKGD